MEEVEKGINAPLNILLLSLVPNIQTLVLSQRCTIIGGLPHRSFIYFFSKAVHGIAHMPAQVRPQIFPVLIEVRLSYQPGYRYYGEYLRLFHIVLHSAFCLLLQKHLIL
jgi:hypothetical protein